MKKSINALKGGNGQTAGSLLSGGKFLWVKKTALMMVFLASCTFTGCQKESNSGLPANQEKLMSQHSLDSDQQFRNYYTGLSKETTWELQQARAATAKYRHIEKALADGYEDINIVRQGMGYHFLKSGFLDANFEVGKPELLVYEKLQDGSFRLVAVEYAVPIALSPNAPDGFTGSGDVWSRNAVLGLWLQHAWVWKNNPAGVFNPTNPLVIVDPDEIN